MIGDASSVEMLTKTKQGTGHGYVIMKLGLIKLVVPFGRK